MRIFFLVVTPWGRLFEAPLRRTNHHANDNGSGGDNIWVDPEYITYLKHKKLKDKISKDLKKVFDRVNKDG
jgi:hypothetical protein